MCKNRDPPRAYFAWRMSSIENMPTQPRGTTCNFSLLGSWCGASVELVWAASDSRSNTPSTAGPIFWGSAAARPTITCDSQGTRITAVSRRGMTWLQFWRRNPFGTTCNRRFAVDCARIAGARWPGQGHPNRFRFLNAEQFGTILP